MRDPKKDAMVSKGDKVKVIDKSKEDDHLKKGYVRAEHMISKELYMREAKTITVTHPKTPNKAIEITVDQWPSFKMRGYHHAEQKENMRLINIMKKASPAAKKALEAPSRVKSPNVTYDKDGKVVKKVNELTIADVRKGTEKAKKRQEKERKATGKTSTSTTDLAARNEGKAYGPTGVSYSDEPNLVSKPKPKKDLKAHKVAGKKSGPHKEDAVDEALDMKQRLARGRSARKNKSKLAMGRKKAGRRIASMKVLKKRARRAARKTLTKRLTKGVAKSDLSVSRKREIEKRLDKPAFKIKANRLVKRTIKDIRKKEIARKRK